MKDEKQKEYTLFLLRQLAIRMNEDFISITSNPLFNQEDKELAIKQYNTAREHYDILMKIWKAAEMDEFLKRR